MTEILFKSAIININVLHESPNNPRGKVIKDDAFKDLVESIKEKGILVPLIVREIEDGRVFVDGHYEVVAGARRLAAARVAGLVAIPCQVMVLTDDEAAEIAIIENLQRQDVHPIDEGEAYRKLHEDKGIALADIAVRVGKKIQYVKQRMFLTNLNEDLRNQYRVGRFKDTVAILLARLSAHDQKLAFEAFKQGYNTSPELGDWIKDNLYAPLDHQPWLDDAKANLAVGPCTSCPPNKDGLFLTASAGACIDTKCWRTKMAKYLEYLKAKEPNLAFISTEYGDAPKGVHGRGQYVELTKKDKCASAHRAVVAIGAEVGDIKLICSDPDCKTHGRRQSNYTLSPKEQEKRKKEMAAAKAKSIKAQEDIKKYLDKITWPVTKPFFASLVALEVAHVSAASNRNICKRHGWEVKPDKNNYRDYGAELKKQAKTLSATEQLQLYIEMRLEDHNQYQGAESLAADLKHLIA